MNTSKCDSCGYYGNKVDPMTGARLLVDTERGTLCASCRVTERLKTGYYEQ